MFWKSAASIRGTAFNYVKNDQILEDRSYLFVDQLNETAIKHHIYTKKTGIHGPFDLMLLDEEMSHLYKLTAEKSLIHLN
jgi:hypothetical protein